MRREKTQRQKLAHFFFQDFIAIVHYLTFFLKLQFLESSDSINILGFIQSKKPSCLCSVKGSLQTCLKSSANAGKGNGKQVNKQTKMNHWFEVQFILFKFCRLAIFVNYSYSFLLCNHMMSSLFPPSLNSMTVQTTAQFSYWWDAAIGCSVGCAAPHPSHLTWNGCHDGWC